MKFSFYSISTYETYLREHYNDVITPAKNLSYLSDHAVELVECYERKGVQAVVFYTDILNFRDINILHGYEAGSHVLKLIAEKLMAAFPDGIIIRMSSDHKVKDIIETAKNLYDQGSYSIVDNKEFTRDVMKKMEGKKVYHKKKPDKISDDALTQFLDNNRQS